MSGLIATQYFSDVPLAVWEFEIGAYQVCEKWLRDRRGEALTHAAIRQYRQVLAAVAETLRVMQAIDEGIAQTVAYTCQRRKNHGLDD